jgi:RNA polymerase sigma-70 factor (ECF subfamily)
MLLNGNPEKELLILDVNIDKRLLELLFKLYYPRLCAYATTFIKVPDLAEEIVQETFIKLWENRASIKVDVSFKAYIFKSVHNNCINYLKRSNGIKLQSKQMVDDLLYHNDLTLQNFSSDIIDNLVSEELESRLKNALNELPAQCRNIFIMNRFDQLTYSEIAKELDISINTVKTQMKRAIKKLRVIFDQI